MEFGRYKDSPVLVECKADDGIRTPNQSNKRLDQLCAVLAELRRSNPLVPECMGWTFIESRQISLLVFSLAPKLQRPPVSLLGLLPKKRSRLPGPSLDDRFKLAFQLASFLDKLHSVGWVHKNLRSENILFFKSAT